MKRILQRWQMMEQAAAFRCLRVTALSCYSLSLQEKFMKAAFAAMNTRVKDMESQLDEEEQVTSL